MRIAEKVEFLKTHFYTHWVAVRKEVDEEVSSNQPMKCVCGRLATGLHESYCRKFITKVDNTTAKKMWPTLVKEVESKVNGHK